MAEKSASKDISSQSGTNEASKESSSGSSLRDKFLSDDDLPIQPSRWLSLEFCIWWLQAIIVAPYVLYQGYAFCEEVVKSSYVRGIQTGWLMGRKQDLSDDQWKVWRTIFPALSVGFAIFLSISHLIKRRVPKGHVSNVLLFYYLLISSLVVFYLHRTDIVWLFLISFVNFLIAKIFRGSRWNPILTWTFNMAVLWSCDYYRGYRAVFRLLDIRYLENHGILSWQTYFKMNFLRHIAFNMDYYWMLRKRKPAELKTPSAYTIAQETHHSEEEYTMLAFFAYVFYIPFFIAGPIVNFNAFFAQVKEPQKTYSFRAIFIMFVKVLFYTLALEIGLHFYYFYAFNEYNVWKRPDFPAQYVALTGFWTLNFMYMKFLIIWRFFRVVALFDGIDSPENMNRCVDNNYTFAGFWRSWHGSMNKWIIRYMYVPMGGTKYLPLTVWFIFIFVGLWHDLKTRWVAWALINCCCLIVEIAVMAYFRRRSMLWLWKKWYWRYISIFSGELNIFFLMCANLAILHGFSGTPQFLQRVFFTGTKEGYFTIALFFYILHPGVMWMFEIREGERRTSQKKKF